MIPVQRRPLPAVLATRLHERSGRIKASMNRHGTARVQWHGARTVRRDLRGQLVQMCARPAFCMYCHESRGTDVDHFVPIARDPMLTFAWENHVLACGYCNQQAKNEHFPVDAGGHPLLLDPCRDDSALHVTLASTGEFIDLTPRGAATIDVLGLNERSELVQARYRSWRGVIRIFERAAVRARHLDVDDLEDLRFLPVVDAFHHFAHDVGAGRLTHKAVAPAVVEYAAAHLAVLSGIFAACDLRPDPSFVELG